MRILFAVALLTGLFAAGIATAPASAEMRCRMEQQCRWVNFKKICHYVKVCREH